MGVSQELYGRLVHNYNRQLRPVRRPDVPVSVHLGASLVEVLGLDEVRSHITLKIWLTLDYTGSMNLPLRGTVWGAYIFPTTV